MLVMNIPPFAKLTGLMIFVAWIYYRVQFRRWRTRINRILMAYNYDGVDRSVVTELPGRPGLWALEILYFYAGERTGRLVKYEVDVDPSSFTNTLVFSYWLSYVLRHTVTNSRTKVEIFNYLSYEITLENRTLSHWDSLITK